jgi:DNA-binding transcriptional LysR family regulator
MMDIQPTDLRYFLEVAKTLNISRAAERLNLGQPAISQSLRRIESVIGTPVFDRFKTGVQLTSAGKKLLQEGHIALEHWTRLKQQALDSENKIEGSYSIGCHPSVAIYSLPFFLGKLLGDHPHLDIRLEHGLSREIAESVISFRLDFGIVMNPVRHPDLIIKILCEDQFTFWTSPQGNRDVLLCDPALGQSQELIRRATAREITFERYLNSESLEVIAELAAAGCGVALLPERVARRHPQLTRLKKDAPFETDKLCLVYRADRRLSLAGKTITSAISAAKI